MGALVGSEGGGVHLPGGNECMAADAEAASAFRCWCCSSQLLAVSIACLLNECGTVCLRGAFMDGVGWVSENQCKEFKSTGWVLGGPVETFGGSGWGTRGRGGVEGSVEDEAEHLAIMSWWIKRFSGSTPVLWLINSFLFEGVGNPLLYTS